MSKPIITIIGLGLRGTSLGLALQREEGNFEIVGHDKDPDAANTARKLNAVHRTEWNLHRSCEGADMLVLALPLRELGATLELVREDLKSDSLIFAIVNVMQPAIDIARQYLPAETHFVAGHPVLTGVGGALAPRADLFENVTFGLAPSVETDGSAVQLASDFVERVGAKPLFLDAYEHDGITAGVEQLPQLLGAVLMQASSAPAGWQEARRLAGRQFAQTTEMDQSPEQMFGAFQSNKESLLIHVERMQQELASWHELLAIDQQQVGDDEEHPLLTALKQSYAAREQWEAQAFLQNWEEAPATTDAADNPSLLQSMFFGNLMRGRRQKEPS